MGAPVSPFSYRRSYPYECAREGCRSHWVVGCGHVPKCAKPHARPCLVDWKSVPIPVCERCRNQLNLY